MLTFGNMFSGQAYSKKKVWQRELAAAVHQVKPLWAQLKSDIILKKKMTFWAKLKV